MWSKYDFLYADLLFPIDCVQIKELCREKPTEVSEGLYALSCGPNTQV